MCTLLLKTKELLLNRPSDISLEVIASDTGLPYSWIVHMTKASSSTPAVDRCQALYEYLSGRKLDL